MFSPKVIAILASGEGSNAEALWQKAKLCMVSHCAYPLVDNVPAPYSRRILLDMLRHHVGFGGLCLSDDMTMGAVWHTGTLEAQAIRALAAGVDLLLVCQGLDLWENAVSALAAEAKKNTAFHQRLREAASRVQLFRAKDLSSP